MNEYIKVKIERLFHGFASVRLYIWEKAKSEGKGLKLFCHDKVMTVDFDNLDNCLHSKEIFTSKHDCLQKYHLVDFDFKPDQSKVEPIQFNIFDTFLSIKNSQSHI